jgi:hypothetical protein
VTVSVRAAGCNAHGEKQLGRSPRDIFKGCLDVNDDDASRKTKKAANSPLLLLRMIRTVIMERRSLMLARKSHVTVMENRRVILKESKGPVMY